MEFRISAACHERGGSADFANLCVQENTHSGGAAFFFEHTQNVARGTVAEELSQSFFVIGDAMLFDEGAEISGRVASQGRLRKVRIGGEKIIRLAAQVGEIATAAAGDENLFTQTVGMFEDGDAASAFAGFDGAHQAGCASAENKCVE